MRAFLLAVALLLSAACRPHAAPAFSEWLAAGYAERQFDLAAAVDFYRRALEADPDNLKITGRLLRMRVAEGEAEGSLELARALDAAISEGAAGKGAAFDRALVTLRLVVDAVRREDWQEAARRLDGPGGKAVPKSVRLLALAWVRQAMGDDEAAEAALAEAGKARGAAGWAALHRALLLHVSGRAADAAAAFDRLGDAGAGRRGVLAEAAYRMASADTDTARQLLWRYREMGGSLYAEEPAGLAPLASTSSDGVAEVLYGVAEGLQRRRAPMSLIYARLAAMLDPERYSALLLAGDFLASRDRYDEALAAYGQVPAESIWWTTALQRRAKAYAAQDRFERAAALLEAEAGARPQDPFALGELGHLLRGKERFEDAAAAYDRAIARIDKQAEPRHWRLFYGRGIAFERIRKWDRAERDLLKALDFAPNQAFVLNYLGYSWVDRGEHYERAEKMLAKAVELRPRDGYIADSLGWVYFRTGRYPEAVAELERAVALEPLEPVVNEHLGDAYWKVGRRIEAEFQWRRALDFDPEPDRVEELRQRLACGLDCG